MYSKHTSHCCPLLAYIISCRPSWASHNLCDRFWWDLVSNEAQNGFEKIYKLSKGSHCTLEPRSEALLLYFPPRILSHGNHPWQPKIPFKHRTWTVRTIERDWLRVQGQSFRFTLRTYQCSCTPPQTTCIITSNKVWNFFSKDTWKIFCENFIAVKGHLINWGPTLVARQCWTYRSFYRLILMVCRELQLHKIVMNSVWKVKKSLWVMLITRNLSLLFEKDEKYMAYIHLWSRAWKFTHKICRVQLIKWSLGVSNSCPFEKVKCSTLTSLRSKIC